MPIAKPDSAEGAVTENLEWSIRTAGTWQAKRVGGEVGREGKDVLLWAFPQTSLSFWIETLGMARKVMGCFGNVGFVGRCGGRGFWVLRGDWYMTRLAFAKGKDKVIRRTCKPRRSRRDKHEPKTQKLESRLF